MHIKIKFVAVLIVCLLNFRAAYAFAFDENTKISDIVNNSLFDNYGRLIFPLNKSYYSGDTLGNSHLTWYSNIKSARTVEVINYMSSQVQRGGKIFYPIYHENDPRSRDTGLFFFKGRPGNKFVDVRNYSLCGGSAGARMAAWLGSYGTEYFGEREYPRPSAVIMQYTGLSEVTGNEPATYNCVGTLDGIADYRIMKTRINRIKANGTDAMIEIFDGLSHGFGLGEGTVAEGWLDSAVNFWEKQKYILR